MVLEYCPFFQCPFIVMLMRKKNVFPARVTVCMEFAHSPHVCGDFFWGLRFLPTSQRCASEVNGVSTLPQAE